MNEMKAHEANVGGGGSSVPDGSEFKRGGRERGSGELEGLGAPMVEKASGETPEDYLERVFGKGFRAFLRGALRHAVLPFITGVSTGAGIYLTKLVIEGWRLRSAEKVGTDLDKSVSSNPRTLLGLPPKATTAAE